MIEKLLQLCVLIVLLIVVTVVMSACLFASVTPSSTDNPLTPQTSGTVAAGSPHRLHRRACCRTTPALPDAVASHKDAHLYTRRGFHIQQQALPRYGILYYLRDRQVWTGFGAPDDWRLAKLPVEEGGPGT